jgi:hypothetical protein
MVRIDVNAGLDISEDTSAAIIAATIGYVLNEDVSVVQVDGSALSSRPPERVGRGRRGA